MEHLEQFCPVWWDYAVRKADAKITGFYKVPHIYASYLKLALGSHAVQGLFPARKMPSTRDSGGGPVHPACRQTCAGGAQCGRKPSCRMPAAFPLLLSLWLFSLAPLLLGWDEHRLTLFCICFNSAGLGCLGDFTTLPLQPAVCYMRWVIQIVYSWVKRWPVALHEPFGF